jgi:hypothetical protein
MAEGTVATSCCIMRMRHSRVGSRLITLFALLATIGQVVISFIAPISDGAAGQSAPAHVEEQGVTKHYAHDDATCAACVAHTLLSLPILPRAPIAQVVRGAGPAAAAPRALPARDRLLQAPPRAPPSLA